MVNSGLVIWGCKGGHRVFCSSPGIDISASEISNTIKDLRSCFRFKSMNQSVYALEFTDRFKVYTLYRSCYDSGTGAYVAISIYVPHNISIKARDILDKMMDTYFSEYVDVISGMYLPGKYDDITKFVKILEGYEEDAEISRYKLKPSVQNDKPSVYLYSDVQELDKLFGLPYRKEFFACQEVLFMTKETDADVMYVDPRPSRIVTLSEPEIIPPLCLTEIGGAEIVFSLKGNEGSLNKDYHVNDSGSISVKITYPRCEPIRRDNTNIGRLKSEGLLIERDRKLVLNEEKVLLSRRYKDYEVRFELPDGRDIPEGLLSIKEMGSYEEKRIRSSKASIPGNKLDSRWEILLQPQGSGTSQRKIGEFRYDECKERNIIRVDVNTIKYRIIGRSVRFQVYSPKNSNDKIADIWQYKNEGEFFLPICYDLEKDIRIETTDNVDNKDIKCLHQSGTNWLLTIDNREKTPDIREKKIKLRIMGCGGLWIKGDGGQWMKISNDNQEPFIGSEKVSIYRAQNDPVPVCEVFREKELYTDKINAQNLKGGFSVEYADDNGMITVIRQENNKEVSGKPDKGGKRKRVLSCLGMLVLMALALTGGLALYKSAARPALVVEFLLEEDPDLGEEISGISVDGLKKRYVKTDSNRLTVNRNAKAPKNNNGDPMKVTIDVGAYEFERDFDIWQEFEKPKKGSSPKKISMKVQTDLQKGVNELKELSNPKDVIERCGDLLEKAIDNEAAENYILNLASEKLDRESFLEKFKDYEESEVYEREQKNAEEEKRNADWETRKKELTDQLNKKKEALRSINCTKSTLDNVVNWWEELPNDEKNYIRGKKGAYDIEKAIKAYGIFFSSNKYKDFKEIKEYKKFFSREQQDVIWGTGTNTKWNGYISTEEKYKEYRGIFNGMSFSEPYKQGYIKQEN